MRLTVLFLALIVLPACGSKSVHYEPVPKESGARPAIIFIPGFYGTALADAETGERYFLSAWKATFSDTPLALVESDLSIPGSRPMREDGLLSHVRIIPGIYSVNVYRPALNFLNDKFGDQAEIIPFPYDWRQDIFQSAKRLDDLVRTLKARGVPRILIVSHSMGGLVAAHFLSRADLEGRNAINAVVIAGTPFSGALSPFRNLQLGTSLGPSKKPLAYDSLGTFPSMYELIPQPETGAYVSSEMSPLGEEALSPVFWRKIQYGLFRVRADVTSAVQEKREAFVTKSLENGRKFSRTITRAAEKGDPKPAMLYFVGVGQSTLTHVMWSRKSLSEKGTWLYDDEEVKKKFPDRNLSSLYSEGDVTVSAKSATPPPGLLSRLPGQIVKVKSRHEEMFEDESLLDATEKFLKAHL